MLKRPQIGFFGSQLRNFRERFSAYGAAGCIVSV